VLTPVCRGGKDTLSITLHGDLAGIRGLAAKAKGPLDPRDPVVLFVARGLERLANRI
jgi:hypothetical protein